VSEVAKFRLMAFGFVAMANGLFYFGRPNEGLTLLIVSTLLWCTAAILNHLKS
jgi:hypothetical protein